MTDTTMRQQLIDRIMWLDADSGLGFGIPSFGNMMMWGMQEPGPDRPDWKSVVAVKGPDGKYTDEELALLADFSDRYTADYDTRWRIRMGANLVIFDKQDGWAWDKDGHRIKNPPPTWLGKRMSWESGPMVSDTLAERLAVFEKELRT